MEKEYVKMNRWKFRFNLCPRSYFHQKFLLFFSFVFLSTLFLKQISLTTNTDSSSSSSIETPGTSTCVPYTVSDQRSFFERESPLVNPPRRISYSSDEDLRNHLHSLRLVTLACARNVEEHVQTFRKHIEPIVNLFHSSSPILILESDSTDKTLEKLKQWSRAQVFTHNPMIQSILYRPQRIAHCRNELLSKARQLPADYILFVDFDGFRSNISAFISNFRYHTDDWAVMTASASVSYYDIWALRTLSDSILNFDIWRKVWELQDIRSIYCHQSVVDQIITINQKAIPSNYGLIEVRSAFGGAGLYQIKAIDGCNYSTTYDACEHVPFHLCIREKNQGRIFINPEFQIS